MPFSRLPWDCTTSLPPILGSIFLGLLSPGVWNFKDIYSKRLRPSGLPRNCLLFSKRLLLFPATTTSGRASKLGSRPLRNLQTALFLYVDRGLNSVGKTLQTL